MKVSWDQYEKFRRKFFSCRGDRKHRFYYQRFGQAFCNEFGVHDEYIFYSSDIRAIQARIQESYLEEIS